MIAMQQPQEPLSMTEMEYLEFERNSDIRHEYSQGYVYAMAGASRTHNLISHNISRVIGNQIVDKDCELYQSDMKVRTIESDYTYPDLVIVCGEPKFGDKHSDTLLNPTLIIEVLSPSTERYDRGKKFQDYREIDSLKEYVLVAQDKAHIERFVRQKDVWILADVKHLDTSITLTSIDYELQLSDIYHKVKLTE